MGDGRVHQYRFTAQFHRDGGIGGGTDTGIDQHRHFGFFKNDLQVVRVADTQTAADQASQRHDRDAADFGQLAGDDRVITGVDHHLEAVLDQNLGGLEGFDHIREQGFLVSQHFELDQIAAVEQFPGQAAGTHGLGRIEAAGGIRQNGVTIRRQHVQQVRLARVLAQVGAAHCNGDDLGTRRFDGQTGLFHIDVLAGAYQQARLESPAGQDEGLVAANIAHRKSS